MVYPEIEEMKARLEAAMANHIPWSQDHPPIPAPQVSGMSKAQKALLGRLYRETQATHTRYQEEIKKYGQPIFTHNPESCGVQWLTHGSEVDNERSHAASQSRTLHRLADRGLVVRLNNYSGGKSKQATYVRLTEAGLALAAQMNKDNG